MTEFDLDDENAGWMIDQLLTMLQTPSPSGRTDAVMQVIGEILSEVGIDFELTRRGAISATLPGASNSVDRAVVVHADTIGCMVSGLKDNGRLSVIPVGTFSARFATGARVKIFRDGTEEALTGTIMPLLASGHAFGDDIDTQPTNWDSVEVRVDRRVETKIDLEALGLQIGDAVTLNAAPELTQDGFIVSRHLDGKAGVAIGLTIARDVARGIITLPHTTQLLVTITEEVGHGASHGLPLGVAEIISIDNAVCAPGQASIEAGVTIPMADLHGPFDHHLTRNLCAIAESSNVPYARDVFKFYRSDVAAAIEAGSTARAALVAFGLDGSHGWERTHFESLRACYRLVGQWLQTPLTMQGWDEQPTGPLRQFPSANQPVQPEQWVPLSRGDVAAPADADTVSQWPPARPGSDRDSS